MVMHCVAIKLLLFLWKNSEAAFVDGTSKLNQCDILGGCQQRHHIIFHASLSTSNNDVINTDGSIIRQRNNALLYASPNDGINITDGSNNNKEKKHRRNKLPTSTRERTEVIIYNKPTNVITSHVSQSSTDPRKTVYEDIYSMRGFISSDNNMLSRRGDASIKNFADATQIQSKLHAIGRLDADTTGLLLLTNDGVLVHKITNPNAKNEEGLSNNLVQKTYEAVIMGYHDLPDVSIEQSTFNYDTYPLQQLIDEGVSLSAKHGGQTKPVDDLTILSHPTRTTTHVSITISEGKNRQIRRMFHAVGSGVMKLHRVSIGRLTLSGLKQERISEDSNEGLLKEGEWRLLAEKEIEQGLGYKCRNLDEFHDEGQYNGGRRFNHRQKRKGSAGRPKRAKR